MYLIGTFLGIGYFANRQVTPTPIAYSSITFFGNCIIDNIQIKNIILTNSEIDAINITQPTVWDSHTLLSAKFANNLNGGNVLNINNPISRWEVNRKEINDTALTKLNNVDVANTQYIDYTAPLGKTFIYNIFPSNDTEIGQALETPPITTDFYGWFLIDQDLGVAYKFDLNLSSGNIENNTDITEYETYTQYNAFSFGNRDFIRGTIKCIAGTIDMNDQLLQSVDYIENLKNFINNKSEKLLKSRKGNIWRVVTKNFQYQHLDDIADQLVEISFDFVESGSV